MIAPISTPDTPGSGIADTDPPVFHICPTCGGSALSGKSARYATKWELVHGRSYLDFSIPCERHEVA